MVKRGLSASLAVIALTAMPAAASAGTRSQSTTLSGGAPAALSATCPKGQRASGGGFTFPPPGTNIVEVFESRKVGQRSWRIGADPSGTSPVSVTAFAYCSADAPKTKERSTTFAVTTSGISTADAGCGGAGKAMAGGFSTVLSTAYAPLVDSFRADKRTWRSRVTYGAGSPTLTSFVYCADEKKPVARTGSVVFSNTNALVTALSPECKRGTTPVAGGFSQPNAPSGSYGYHYASFRAGKRWQASAEHSGSVSSPLNSIAYCA